ncbi:MAG: response regulator [Chitinophagaceae bacterium]|nr:MAG: response regulator [Chitinophagaceae bacterium]
MDTKEKIDVLILDDDPDLSMLMETILKFNDYNVRSCTNVPTFKKLMSQVEPTLIIMDMFLADQDGKDVCRELKADESTRLISIMMVSAHPDADRSCREAGANDFLIKPFDIDDFTAKVASYARLETQG